MWLICSAFAELIFDYSSITPMFSDNETGEMAGVSKAMADMNLFFWTGSLFYTAAFLKWEDIRNTIVGLPNHIKVIGKGIGFAFLLRLGFGFYVFILKEFGVQFENILVLPTSVSDHIISVNIFYSPWVGFLFVVILVPIYEEILFRGIFLSACQRNMKFVLANSFQAIVFALVHQRLILIPFYFAFGFLAGSLRKETNSMLAGTTMHMTNNLIVFLAILARS